MPTFDDLVSAFRERQRGSVAVVVDLATVSIGQGGSARTKAEKARKAIIEIRQDPASCGGVCHVPYALAIYLNEDVSTR